MLMLFVVVKLLFILLSFKNLYFTFQVWWLNIYFIMRLVAQNTFKISRHLAHVHICMLLNDTFFVSHIVC